MLVGPDGDVTITNDGATILSEMNVCFVLKRVSAKCQG